MISVSFPGGIVIVSVRHHRTLSDIAAVEESDVGLGRNLSPIFLIGKLLNALLLAWRIRIEDRALADRRGTAGPVTSPAER